MSMRTPLAEARGLGSAKSGTGHWWSQRLTAVALVPLTLWLVFSLTALVGADHATVVAWLGSPLRLALLILFLGAMFHHAQLGLQVVIEDYIQHEGTRLAVLVGTRFLLWFLAAVAVLAALRTAFSG
jgi:succinate dehydrogenase / fumarate reductase membrane anchor subunit